MVETLYKGIETNILHTSSWPRFQYFNMDDLNMHTPLLTPDDDVEIELNPIDDYLDKIFDGPSGDESPNLDFVPGHSMEDYAQVPQNYHFPQPVDRRLQVDFNGTLREWYRKRQHNVRKNEWYLEDPIVNVSICFSSAQAIGMVEKVSFYVKKLVEDDSQNPLGDVPRLPISLELHPTQPKIDAKLNIDSCHKHNDHVVFKLPKVPQTSPKKQFCVITEVKYRDEVQGRREHSLPFLVTTTPPSPPKQQQVPTNVAANQDELSRSAEFDSVRAGLLEAGSISADHIFTKSIRTKSGDTAYNFPQVDPEVEFEEGEVVGIGIHPRRRNAQAVFRITTANIYTFRFFGVVSRSYYIQARAPPSNSSEKTETICMYGQVPIRVRGTVKCNDDIIPSATYPGYGEARRFQTAFWRQRSSEQLPVLGIALSTHDCSDTPIHIQGASKSCIESPGTVLAGVSLLDSANRFQVENKINKHTRELSKRNCRRLAVYFSISALVLGLVSILIWQVLPGSALRKAMCAKDTLVMRCMFQYQSDTNEIFQPIVKGREIMFRDLKERVNIPQLHPVFDNKGKEREGMRYFLNIDQCMYGEFENPAEKQRLRVKEFYGPYFFATDEGCTEAYYWFTDIFKKHSNVTCEWKKYRTVSSKKWENIQCHLDGDKRPLAKDVSRAPFSG